MNGWKAGIRGCSNFTTALIGAYDARIVFSYFIKQFKCVEIYHFSTIDYFSVKLAPVVKLIQYYLCEKESQFFVRHVSDIWYSQSLQSVCGSQAVEHSERLTPNSNIHCYKLLLRVLKDNPERTTSCERYL